MRLELKENAAEIDVIPVMKTRQAIRTMSHQLEETLDALKKLAFRWSFPWKLEYPRIFREGFMPADSTEKWEEVVTELRESADGILWTPQLAYLLVFSIQLLMKKKIS